MNVKAKRMVMVLLAGLALILVMAAFLFFRFYLPVGTGPAGPFVDRGPFSNTWNSRSVLLVGLGDSVTAGFGARHGYSYFDRLTKTPTDEFSGMQGISLSAIFPNLKATNLAISGSTSGEVPSRQLSSLHTNSPDVLGIVVMTTGGNDIIHNYGRTEPREEAMYGATFDEAAPWIKDFAARLDLTISQIESRFPGGCEIFMANIFDPTDGFGDADRAGLPHWPDGTKILDAYNQVIQQCAAKHSNFHVIDMHAIFLGHGIHCTEFWRSHFDLHDPHYWYYSNLEDPNERGYDVIRRLFLLEMIKDQSRLKAN